MQTSGRVGGAMDRVHDVFREGVMSHLERLESLSQNLAQRQEERRVRDSELEEKRALIVRLQRERQELHSQIRLQRETIEALSASKESEPKAESTQSALQELRLEEMRGVMEALWYTGISGKLKDDAACFCIGTAYEGAYLDSYYIQVTNMKSPQISRHSVPAFVPLSDLAKEYLPDRLRELLRVLYERLNGYAGRKVQADRLEEECSAYVGGSLQRNSLHSVLSFTYNILVEGRTISFAAKLLYGDLASTLPTEVTVTCSDDEASSAREMISSHVSLFSSTALHRALDSLAA